MARLYDEGGGSVATGPPPSSCCQITGAVPAVVAGALVSTGAPAGSLAVSVWTGLEATPLAEAGGSEADGSTDGSADSDAEGVGVAVSEGVVDGEVDVDGLELGVADGEVVGVDVLPPVLLPPPGVFVPVGSSDGSWPSVGGVGSSEVPIVPSGPGSVGRLVAVPVSPLLSLPPLSALLAPRLSSLLPGLADGLTPTWSDGASLGFEVAPSVTTVPSTAARRAPAPTATRLRRAPPTSRWTAEALCAPPPPDRDAITVGAKSPPP